MKKSAVPWTLITLMAGLCLSSASAALGDNRDLRQISAQAIISAGVTIEPSRRMQAKGYPWAHEIQISLPPSYHKTNKVYPVLWVTDGSVMFDLANQIVNVFAERSYIPELIIVAVGVPAEASKEYHRRRMYDFTPTKVMGFHGLGSALLEGQLKSIDVQLARSGVPLAQRFGGAADFLAFLVDTVRPALARDYRMAKDHTLFGHSRGGEFCTYALLSRPDAFAKYICTSPSLYNGDFELFRMEQHYSEAHKDMVARVFFAAGEGEALEGGPFSAWGPLSSVARMTEILKLRAYPSLELHFRILPGEEHMSMAPAGLSWGLRTLWARKCDECGAK